MTLDWKAGGLSLGLVFFLAVLLVKPIGVSTQFVVADGIAWNAVSPGAVTQTADGYASTNAYLDKYAKSVASPLNYGFVFVLAMVAGGALSVLLRGGLDPADRRVPDLWRANFGDGRGLRFAAAFVGGVLVLYGARMAGGCTSGHMMSGMMQTALSGYVFAAGAFAAAIPTAMLLYRQEG